MKRARAWWLKLLVVLAATRPACGSIVVDHTCLEVKADGSLAEIIPQVYLDGARQLKVLFCHASVGGTIVNAMAGNKGLAKLNASRYLINQQANAEAAWFDSHSGLINISRTDWPVNGSKARGFDHLIRNLGYGLPSRTNVAFMKYCYIDWLPGTNVEPKWTEYRTMMEALEADYPSITFVWWTTAITAAGDGGDLRERFNTLVREYCAAHGKVLFDLADIESHDLQGNPCYDDIGAEAMYAGYAVDGQHPTDIGQMRLASAVWWLLARIAGWQVEPTRIDLTVAPPLLGVGATATTQVTARLFDEQNGLFVTAPDRQITFALSGPGSLIEPTMQTSVNGRATVAYATGSSPGIATITATSVGLTEGSATVSLFANNPPGPPTDLRCIDATDPMRLPTGWSELAWTFNDPDTDLGDTQSAYRLIVADNPADIDNDVRNVWDTGKTASAETSAILSAAPLRHGPTYYWKIKTWDLSGEEGSYSDPAAFALADGTSYAVTGEVDFSNGAGLDLYGPNGLTIEMWVCRTEENVETVLLDKFVPNGGGYRIGVDVSNHLYFRTRGERKGDRRAVALATELHKGRWYHVACCQLGTAGTDDGVIFVDGIECGRNTLIYSPWPVGANLRLTASGAVVDELRLSDNARYTGIFTPPPAPFAADAHTAALWHFDEAQGTITNDDSGHSHTGTLDPNSGWAAGYCANEAARP